MHFQQRLTSKAMGGLLWFVITVTAATSASTNEQLEAIYHPLKVERAALAPDGAHAAFVTCDSEGLHLVVYRIDQPALAVHRLLDTNADVHAQFLDWAGSDRLVVSTDASVVVVANPLTRESSVVAEAATFATRKGPNPSVNLRVVGLSESPQGVVLEVSRFAPALVVQEAVMIELAPFDLDWPRNLNPTEGENLRATKLRGLEAFRPPLAFLGQETTGAYQGEFEFQFAKWCFKSAVHPSGSVDGQAGKLTLPVLLLHDPHSRANPIERVQRFAGEVKPLAQVAELSPLFLRKVPVARVPVFRQIGDFLKANVDKPVVASALSKPLK